MALSQKLKRVPIAVRLAVMIGGIMIVFIGFLAYWAFRNLETVSLERAGSNASALARQVAMGVVVGMVGEHAGHVDDRETIVAGEIQPLVARENIRSVVVAGTGGRVTYSHRSPFEPGDVLDATTTEVCRLCHGGDGVVRSDGSAFVADLGDDTGRVTAAGHIFNRPACSSAACHAHSPEQKILGVIAVEQSLEPVMASLSSARRGIVIIALLMVITGPISVLFLLRSWLSIPVRSLIDGMSRVAEGNLDAVLPAAEGELGAVAYSFNKMQQRLSASQRQLVQSEKHASLGRIAAGVAHEINNPLTGILTYSEELYEDAAADDPLREDYAVIYRETIRCREIVRNLLDFARRTEPQPSPQNLNEILQRTVSLVSHLALFRNVEIFTDLHDDLPAVNADPGQLEQVFLNFLVNAAEAMTEGGRVRVTTRLRRDGKGVVVSIADEGPGIEEHVLEHIFEPFFSTKRGKSTGLGLSVSWGIIEQHQGHIEVQSEMGAGTTFRVHLPAVDSPPVPDDPYGG